MDISQFCGWSEDHPERLEFAARAPQLSQIAPHLYQTFDPNQPVYLYKAWKDVLGDYPKYIAQAIGDCTSFGTGHTVDLTECIQIALAGKKEAYKETSTEAIYGAGREIANMLHSWGDGCYGGAVAKAVATVGVVPREVVGSYSGQRAKDWGRSGVPQDIKDQCLQHKIKTYALVKTPDDVDAALFNGYVGIVCSNQGFTMTRNADGVCTARGTWAHCCPPDAIISGPRPLVAREIQIGDRVYGHDGKIHHVSAVMTRKHTGEMVKIKATGVPVVRFTPEHPILVEREVKNLVSVRPSFDLYNSGMKHGVLVQPTVMTTSSRQVVWVEAKDVRPGDMLVVPKDIEFSHAASVPTWANASPQCKNIPNDIKISDELAWLFGMYIANGNAVAGHKIAFTINSKKTEAIDRIVKGIEILGLKPSFVRKNNYVRIIAYSSIVANSFKHWFGGGKEEKRIPEFLMSGWNIRALIEGIHAGDGEGRNPDASYACRPRVSTTSRSLAFQMWLLLQSEGMRPNIGKLSRGPGVYPNAKPGFDIAFGWEPDFSDQKRCNHSGYRGGFYVIPVKTVDFEDYDGLVYNWEVEGSNSYIANGIAVHNCMSWSGRRVKNGRRQYCIDQSWGPNTPSGPLSDDQPDFSFWIDESTFASMLSMQDSYVLSAFDGYPGQGLPGHWTPERWA